jgi:hypothetical protein
LGMLPIYLQTRVQGLCSKRLSSSNQFHYSVV